MNWYGFIIACGIVLCIIGAYFTARRRGIEGDIVIDIIIFCLPLAIVFARIYFVIFDIIAGNSWTFSKFIGIDDHGLQGLAIYGGLIGAVLGAVLLTLWKNRKSNPPEKRVSFLQILDLGFVFIILGQGIGRWGNFVNEEAHGYAIQDPALMWFPMGIKKDGVWYYATFFYESMWDLIGFVILFFLYDGKRKSFDGFNFSCYCIYYGVGRSWIEGMREDSLWLVPPTNAATGAGGVRVSQLVSILLIVFGVAFIVVHIVRALRAEKKVFIFVPRSSLSDEYFGYDKTKLAHPMPDLYPEKKKKPVDITVDSSGVVIHGDDEDAADTAKTDDNKSAEDNHKPIKKPQVSARAEEIYEDNDD